MWCSAADSGGEKRQRVDERGDRCGSVGANVIPVEGTPLPRRSAEGARHASARAVLAPARRGWRRGEEGPVAGRGLA